MKVTNKEFAPIDLSQTGPKPVEYSGTKSKSEQKIKHNYGIPSTTVLCCLLNLSFCLVC